MSEAEVDTIGKITAMARAYASASDGAKVAIQLEYLALLGHLLMDQSQDETLLVPLLDALERIENETGCDCPPAQDDERRHADSAPSEQVLARASGVIDLLIAAGFSQEHASQIVARQMLTHGLRLPETSGDPRGWRRVQLWRQRFLAIGREGTEWQGYVRFKDEMIKTFGSRLAHAAVRHPLWDRRVTAKLAQTETAAPLPG